MTTEGNWTALVDTSEKDSGLPELDENIRCKKHPKEEPEIGFGLAGGGYGTYTYCPECGRVLSKSEEE